MSAVEDTFGAGIDYAMLQRTMALTRMRNIATARLSC